MFKQARNVLALGAAAISAAACGGSSGSTGNGPMIGAIQSVAVAQDTTAVVPIPVTDKQASVSSLSVVAMAAGNSLVLPQGITLQNNGGAPTLYVTPAEDATGSTVINVMATDPQGGMAQQSFTLTVNAVDVSFTTFAEGVLAKAETDPSVQVRGFTFVQDADNSTAFDAVVQ